MCEKLFVILPGSQSCFGKGYIDLIQSVKALMSMSCSLTQNSAYLRLFDPKTTQRK